MLLNGHVCCVGLAFKMTKWVEQWICIKFLMKIEHSPAETIWMIQKPAAWATGDWQLHHNNSSVHASCPMENFFVKHQIAQVDSAPLQPRFGSLQLLAFPQTKITFEREEISDHQWDSGKYDGAADGKWENCVRSQGAYFKGDWGVIVLCTVFPVSCTFFNKCLYFS